MLRLIVGKFAVNLVGNAPNLIFDHDFCDFFKLVFWNHCASRIVRAAHHHGFGFGSDCLFNLLGCGVKSVHARVNRHDFRLCKLGERGVVHIAWLNDDDFVSWVQNRAQNRVNTLARAHRNQNFVLGIVVEIVPLHIFGDFLAEFNQTPVRGVGSVPLFKMIIGFLADNPGRREIRLAHRKRNHIIMPNQHLKKLADA